MVEEQSHLLEELGALRRPLELIRFLEQRAGGSWHCLAREYEDVHSQLEQLEKQVGELKKQRMKAYAELKALKQARLAAEQAIGEHFRTRIFGKQHSEKDLKERRPAGVSFQLQLFDQ